jgi:general secretion pathway protein F
MEVYRYHAAHADGRGTTGEIAADGELAVYEHVRQLGLTLVDVQPQRRRRIELGRGRSGVEDLIEFTRATASLLAVGIPVLQVLDEQEQGAERRSWRETIRDVRLRIEGGSTVSEAIGAHRGRFGDLYVAMVQAGEESGKLEAVLSKLADYLEWSKALKDEVRRALAYPLVVLAALGGFIALLTFFVFPRLGGLFETLDVELPLPTRIMLAIGDFGRVAWPYVVGFFALAAFAFAEFRRRPFGRGLLDRFYLRIPLVGRIVEMASIARIAHTLSVLIDSGIVLDRALELARKAADNRVFADAVSEVRDRIHGGDTFGAAMERTGRFPRLALRLARTGESSGDLTGMLERLAQHYEREMPYLVRRIVSAIGPITVFTLAGTVLLAALSIFLPLLRITSAISK